MSRLLPIALALALVAGATAAHAAPAESSVQIHTVRKGDTLELLAAEYYGDRNHAVFILKANDLEHPRPLKRREKLKIPVTREITAAVGDTLEGLAGNFLGDPRRAPFLAQFNNLPADASIAAGQELRVPFHVVHRAASKETLAEISAAYFGTKKQAKLLQAYNFLDKSRLDEDETIVVPIHHVDVQRSKLPPPDPESQARVQKRRDMQKQALRTLPGARAAWREGDYGAVKRELTKLDADYLDSELAVEVGVLLGSTYVAFGDSDSALAIFKKVLERRPDHTLDPYAYSPKIRAVWDKARAD